jgi:tetratricopeptide (TPR) repeat protein
LVAKPVRLGKTAKLKIGDPVYAVGAPQGLELSLSAGIVSQLRGGPSPIIQTTVAISPGSSGGGLFNAKGELVGITTFYLNEGQGLNFALPVEWITEVARRETPKHRDSTPKPGANLRTMWEDRITALEKAKDWQGMLAWCRRWTRVEPDNAEPWGILGLAYFKLDRYRDAIEANRQALRLKPDNAEAWVVLGLAYLQLDRYRDAIEANREALRIKPDNAEAWNNLALAYLLSGNRSAALEAVRELRRYNPKGADKLFNLIIKP